MLARPIVSISDLLTKLTASASSSLKAHSAGLGAAVTLLLADLDLSNHVTLHQWVAIAGAYLGVGAVVHMVPNTPAPSFDTDAAQHDDGTDDE